jgi:TolA-binding protein
MTTRPRRQQQRLNEEFLLLLEEQYAVVEEYANAQTFMLNATTKTTTKTATATSRLSSSSSSSSDDDAVINAIERLDKARINVRSNLKDLQEHIIQIQNQIQNNNNNNNNNNEQQRYTNHINLSKRVIETISYNPSWYSNGLPKPPTDNNTNSLQTNTIAIAALKASIATIREIEETI